MSRRLARRAILPIVALAGLCAPAAAHAWTVTVHVHGAGRVVETTSAKLMDCMTSSSIAEVHITDCVAGSPSGRYNSGDVVRLEAQVPAAYAARGWQFVGWVESGAGGGRINCDPQGTPGSHTDVGCQFQVSQNLQIDLYFDDIAAPKLTSLDGPSGATRDTAALFSFDSDDPFATYECKLDGPGLTGTFAGCGGRAASYSSLADGNYTFSVRPVDPSGNRGGTSTRTWRVDTMAPVVTIAGTPAAGATTNSRTARFEVGADEAGASFECSLDDRPFAACGAPASYSDLADGTHVLAVRARDAAGNVGAAASRTWTVDATAPLTDMLGGPAEGSTSTSTTATFNFGSSDPTATFVCRLDGAAFTSCTSPVILSELAPGAHVFEVRAKDPVGNEDASPARRAWRVTAPPVRVSVTARWNVAKALTRVRRLLLTRLERGTLVTVTCKGRRCPVRSRAVKPSRRGVVDVRAILKRRPLRAGTTLTIRVARAQRAAKVLTFRVRKGKAPAATTRLQQ